MSVSACGCWCARARAGQRAREGYSSGQTRAKENSTPPHPPRDAFISPAPAPAGKWTGGGPTTAPRKNAEANYQTIMWK